MKKSKFREDEIVKSVIDNLHRKGFRFVKPMKIRGRIPDIIAIRDGELALVEVKGSRGNIMKGVAQAIHFSHCSNYSYLALPKHLITNNIIGSCDNLGIGLIGINEHDVAEFVKAKHRNALKSVIHNILDKGRSLKSNEIIILPLKTKKKIKKQDHFLEDVLDRYGMKVLRKLCRNKNRDFTISEISKEIGHDKSIISKTISTLIEKELINYRKRGTNKICMLNTENAFVKDALIPLFHKEMQIMNGNIDKNFVSDGYA